MKLFTLLRTLGSNLNGIKFNNSVLCCVLLDCCCAVRSSRLEASLQTANQAVEDANKRRNDMEGVVISQQHEARVKEEKMLECNAGLRQAQDNANRLEIELEVGFS